MPFTTCPVCHSHSLQLKDDAVVCTACGAYKKHLNFLQRVYFWALDKEWWWRLLILIGVIYLLRKYLHDPSYAENRMANPFNALDLGIHELGHFLFIPFGEFMHILGGSLFQCLFPAVWFAVAIRRKWYFAASMILGWLAINLFDVAVYISDARSRLLPLVSLGNFGDNSDAAYDREHDWYQILGRLHALNLDTKIAHGVRLSGIILFYLGLIFGSVLLLIMLRGSLFRRSERPPIKYPA